MSQAKNFFIYFGQTIFTTLVPLLLLIVFARYLSPEDFGALALAQVYAIVLTGVCNLGLPLVFKRNYFEFQDDSVKLSQLLYGCLIFSLSLFLSTLSITWVFGVEIIDVLKLSITKELLVVVFASQYLNALCMYYLSVYINAEKAINYALAMVLSGILNAIFSLYFIIVMELGVIGLPLSTLLSWGIIFIGLTIVFLYQWAFSFSFGVLTYSLKLAAPLAPKDLAKSASTQFDKYMLGLLAAVSDVGIYSVAQRFAMVNNVFMSVLQNIFGPRIYTLMFSEDSSSGEKVGNYLTPFMLLSILPTFFMVLFSDEIIYLLLPPEYEGVQELLIILSLFYGTLFFGMVTVRQMLYKKKTAIISLIVILSMVFNILLNLVLIPKYSAVGAAWATFVAGILTTTFSVYFAQKYYKILWEYSKICWIYVLLIVDACLVFTLKEVDLPYVVQLLFKIAMVCLLIVFCYSSGFLKKEYIAYVSDFFRKK